MEYLKTASFPLVANGLLADAIDEELAKVFEDLENRPGIDKDRTVTIKLKIRPAKRERNVDNGANVDRASELEAARVEFYATSTLPPQQFARKMLAVHAKNALGFESDTNSIKFSPGQRTLPIPDEGPGVMEGEE